MAATTDRDALAAAAIEFLAAYGSGGQTTLRGETQAQAWSRLREAAAIPAREENVARQGRTRAKLVEKHEYLPSGEAREFLESIHKAILRGIREGAPIEDISRRFRKQRKA
jgi:hypothetical protein